MIMERPGYALALCILPLKLLDHLYLFCAGSKQMLMEEPMCLRRQVLLYAAPLLLVASHFPEPSLFALSIPSSLIAFLIPGMKRRMYVSNSLFILSLVLPKTYFLCYGFTVTATYVSISNLCMDKFHKGSLRLALMMESLGMLLSLCSLSSRVLSACLAVLHFGNIYRLVPPPIESTDYGQAYKRVAWLLREASFTDRANEYRAVVGCRGVIIPRLRVDFLVPLVMGSLPCTSKIVICCSSLIPVRKSHWMCFVAYSLSLVPTRWICPILSFFCDFTPGHPFYRLVSAQALYLMVR